MMIKSRVLGALVFSCSFGLILGAQSPARALRPDRAGVGPVEGSCLADEGPAPASLRARPGSPRTGLASASAPAPDAVSNIDFVSHTLLGSPYNHCAAFDATQKRIYGGFGTTFAVFSTLDPAHPRLLGWMETAGTIYGVHYSGTGSSVYLAASDAGLLRVDVTNPSAPAVAASNTSVYPMEMTLSGTNLYVADLNGYLQICDPTTLVSSAAVDLALDGYGADEVFVQGNYAYVGCMGAFVIVDIAATTPAVVNRLDFPIEDPTYPPEIYGVSVQTQGAKTYAYLASYDYMSTTKLSTLQVVDVTNPLAPLSVVGSTGEHFGNGVDVVVKLSGSTYLAYLVDMNSGLRVLDVTNPTVSMPDVRSAYDSPSPSGVVLSGTTAYYADFVEGILILDLSGTETALVGTCEGSYYVRGVAATGRYLYQATYTGLKVVDVSIPGRPATVGTLAGALSGPLRAPSAYGGKTLVGTTSASIQTADVTDPAAPALLSNLPLGATVYDMAVEGNYAYAAVSTAGLRIVSLSNLNALSLAGSYAPGSGSIRALGVREGIVYLADYTGRKLLVVDATTPASPSLVTTELLSGIPYAVCVHGNLLLVGGRQFVDIYDISSPTVPIWLGKYTTTTFSIRALKMVGTTAYLATYDGLDVVDLSMPWAPVSVARYEPGSVYGCALDYDAGYLYLGTMYGGGFMLHVTGSCNDSYEPNDDFVEAWGLQAGRVCDAKLCTASDQDYFKVAPGAGGTVTLTLQPPVGKNYDLLLFDETHSLLASSLTAGDAVEHLAFTSASAGPFYALVRGSDGTQYSSAANYALTYTFTACPAPTLPAYIYMGRRDVNNNAVFDVQDPNQPSTRTGYNLYRSTSPTGPFTLIAGNMVDMDTGTANVQLVDVNSSTGGPYYYQIRDYNGACGTEGP